ncbi:pyridoxal phosphate-dependent decarboxylase family protein [Nocardioides dubius]
MAERRAEPTAARPCSGDELPEVGPDGVGIEATWAVLRDALLPSAFPTDHPRYLAFVGGSPAPAAIIADAALSAAAVYGGSELEAGAVVTAERAAMRWLCEVVGYPDSAHGTFVSGGSLANLSALVAARHGRVATDGRAPHVIVAGASAHSSVRSAAAIMGCEVVWAGSPDHPLDRADVADVLSTLDRRDVVAVVATAGATNTGAVDRLEEISELCQERGVWLHVDAAYGGAAMLASSHRKQFAGIERADSITIDPHKWLFTPFDCAAVLYLNPELALAAHRQRAAYLDVVNEADGDNPADYAAHLSRRARGVPVWASLVANGTAAHVDAVEQCLALAAHAVKEIDAAEHLELAGDPHLSVVLFHRVGWSREQYESWSAAARRGGFALVTPTLYGEHHVLRLCFVNPLTTTADIDLVLESLECDAPLS